MDNNERIIAFLRASEDQLKRIDEILEGGDRPSVKAEPETRLITQEEAARRLGISRTTVWRLIREGALLTVNQRGKKRVRLDSLLRYAGAA